MPWFPTLRSLPQPHRHGTTPSGGGWLRGSGRDEREGRPAGPRHGGLQGGRRIPRELSGVCSSGSAWPVPWPSPRDTPLERAFSALDPLIRRTCRTSFSAAMTFTRPWSYHPRPERGPEDRQPRSSSCAMVRLCSQELPNRFVMEPATIYVTSSSGRAQGVGPQGEKVMKGMRPTAEWRRWRRPLLQSETLWKNSYHALDTRGPFQVLDHQDELWGRCIATMCSGYGPLGRFVIQSQLSSKHRKGTSKCLSVPLDSIPCW